MARTIAKAMERSKVESRYQDLWERIFDHLVLLCAWPRHSARRHWAVEIAALVLRLDQLRLKPKNKRPGLRTIRSWIDLYPAPESLVRAVAHSLQYRKGLPEPELTHVTECVNRLQEQIMEFLAGRRAAVSELEIKR